MKPTILIILAIATVALLGAGLLLAAYFTAPAATMSHLSALSAPKAANATQNPVKLIPAPINNPGIQAPAQPVIVHTIPTSSPAINITEPENISFSNASISIPNATVLNNTETYALTEVNATGPIITGNGSYVDFVTNWKTYCSLEGNADVPGCVDADIPTQIKDLQAIINGTKTSNLTTGLAEWMLSYYPNNLYEFFGCENLTALYRPAYFAWLTYVPETYLPPNMSNSTQFYYVNLTGNVLNISNISQTNYTYNDSGNATWFCQWWPGNYTTFVEPPVENCNNAALDDWENWCNMEENENGVDCSNVNQTEQMRIESVLANESQSEQWRCAHGGG